MKSTQRGIVALTVIGLVIFLLARVPVETASVPTNAVALSTSLSPDDLAKIQSDIRRMQLAIFEEDFQTVLNLGHPRWIAAVGGPDKLRQEIESLGVRAMSAAHQMKFEETIYRDEPTVLRGTENEFVVVPSLCAFRRPGDRFEVPTFDLAVRRIGTSNWRYIGGSELDEQQAAGLFPDFPKDFRFPQMEVWVVGR